MSEVVSVNALMQQRAEKMLVARGSLRYCTKFLFKDRNRREILILSATIVATCHVDF